MKHKAPDLFREFLFRKSWRPEPIVFSGVTDYYQPAERRYRLTWQCLKVALESRQPLSIVTKNALIVRDLDVLQQLAARHLVLVFLSITTLDSELARVMEPRTSIPLARLRAIWNLCKVAVPVGVMVAPIIPGLNDSEIPSILDAAKNAGARVSSYILLRLPLTVEPVFREWLRRTQPLKAKRIEGRIRETRGGKLSSSTWSERMVDSGQIAEQIRKMFRLFTEKHGLDGKLPPLDCSQFQPPTPRSGQMRLF